MIIYHHVPHNGVGAGIILKEEYKIMKLEGLIGATNVTTVVEEVARWIGYFQLTIIAVVMLLIAAYAVWIGIKMAKAEDDGARTEAKKKVIYSVIGILVVGGIIAVLQLVSFAGSVDTSQKNAFLKGADEVTAVLKAAVDGFLNIVITCAVLFAMWVGWKFISADDDSKRTEAKKQLMYTIGAICAVLLINAVAQVVLKDLVNKAIDKSKWKL